MRLTKGKGNIFNSRSIFDPSPLFIREIKIRRALLNLGTTLRPQEQITFIHKNTTKEEKALLIATNIAASVCCRHLSFRMDVDTNLCCKEGRIKIEFNRVAYLVS